MKNILLILNNNERLSQNEQSKAFLKLFTDKEEIFWNMLTPPVQKYISDAKNILAGNFIPKNKLLAREDHTPYFESVLPPQVDLCLYSKVLPLKTT